MTHSHCPCQAAELCADVTCHAIQAINRLLLQLGALRCVTNVPSIICVHTASSRARARQTLGKNRAGRTGQQQARCSHTRGASGPRVTAPARAAGGRGGMWSSRGRRPSRSSPWGRARTPPARPRPPTMAAPAAAAHNPHSAGGQPRKACPPLQLRRHLQQLEKASRQRCAWLPAAGLPGSRARAGHAALRTALDHAASQSACASLSQTSAQAGRRHRRHAAAACPRSLHQPQLHHAALDSCA